MIWRTKTSDLHLVFSHVRWMDQFLLFIDYPGISNPLNQSFHLTMASSMMVSSAATMARSSPAQTSMVAPFTGLKSSAAFPISRKTSVNFSTLPSNGGRIQCMEVWPPEGLKKFETFSYLPPFTDEQLIKEVDYLIRNGWVPCIEFAKVSTKCILRPTYIYIVIVIELLSDLDSENVCMNITGGIYLPWAR